MAKFTTQVSEPLHIENTVNSLALEDLKLPKAFKTYRNMLTDEVIGGAVNLVKSLINKADYFIVVPDGATQAEAKLIKDLNKSLSNLEGLTKSEFLNYILSELDYGHSMFEMVFTRANGNQVFKTFSPIHPINVRKYVYKRNTLEKLELTSAENDGQLIQDLNAQTELSGEKVLMFRVNPDLDNPLGQSILNRCYKPWKKKEIASEYELIGVAKNLSGVLKIKAPAEYINAYYSDPTSENAQYMEELFEQAELIHGGKTPFAVVASDVTDGGQALFDIETIGNKQGNDVDTNAIIKRYETTILMTLFADIMSLGQGSSGSFALSDSKTNLLTLVVESILNSVSQSFTKAIKVAYELNAVKPSGDYPQLSFTEIEKLDFDSFSRGWQRLVKDGLVEMDDGLEAWIRERTKAPAKDNSTVRPFIKSGSSVDTENNERDEKEA